MDSGHLPPFCRFPLRRGFIAKAKSEMQYCGYSFGVGISLVGIAIPNHFRNPGISGMKHCNLEISYRPMVNLLVGIAIPNHFRNLEISGIKHCNLEISYMVN